MHRPHYFGLEQQSEVSLMPNMVETIERITMEVKTLKSIEEKIQSINEGDIDTSPLIDLIKTKEQLLLKP